MTACGEEEEEAIATPCLWARQTESKEEGSHLRAIAIVIVAVAVSLDRSAGGLTSLPSSSDRFRALLLAEAAFQSLPPDSPLLLLMVRLCLLQCRRLVEVVGDGTIPTLRPWQTTGWQDSNRSSSSKRNSSKERGDECCWMNYKR